MLATISTVATANALDKKQRKDNKPSFLDKKITKVLASAICPGAGQFLDGRTNAGKCHFGITLTLAFIRMICFFMAGNLFSIKGTTNKKILPILYIIDKLTKFGAAGMQVYSSLEALFLSKDVQV